MLRTIKHFVHLEFASEEGLIYSDYINMCWTVILQEFTPAGELLHLCPVIGYWQVVIQYINLHFSITISQLQNDRYGNYCRLVNVTRSIAFCYLSQSFNVLHRKNHYLCGKTSQSHYYWSRNRKNEVTLSGSFIHLPLADDLLGDIRIHRLIKREMHRERAMPTGQGTQSRHIAKQRAQRYFSFD